MKQMNISITRDATNIIFTYKKRNPASSTGDYFTNVQITSASLSVFNTSNDSILLSSASMTYSSVLRGYRYIWAYGSSLNSISAITAEVIPTRALGVSITLTPIDSEEFEVADTLQRIDEAVATLSSSIALIQVDTDDIQSRLPASLSGGRMRSQIEGMDSNTLTSASLATSAVDEIVDAVWDEQVSGHLTSGTTGWALANLTGSTITLSQISNSVWTTVLTGSFSANSAATRLSELWRIHGLEIGTALLVTPTSRTAGSGISQTISTLPGNTVSVGRNS